MLVEEAAKRLGMNTQTLRLALQQGLFPFGIAVKTSENRYTYKIFQKRLEKYMEGEDYARVYCYDIGNSNDVWEQLSN